MASLTDSQRIIERYRAQRDRRAVEIRRRQEKIERDHWGAEAGRNHPLLKPDWRVELEAQRIRSKMWRRNPYMLYGHRASAELRWWMDNIWS